MSPAAAKMSITSPDATAFETIWRIAWSRSSSDFRSPAALRQNGAHRLIEPDFVSNAHRLITRNREGEGLRKLGYGGERPILAIFLLEDVLLRRRQRRQPLLRLSRKSTASIESVEQASAHFDLFL